MTKAKGVITITCVYCGHTWTESIAKLEEKKRVFYREDTEDEAPSHTVDYLVRCPKCGEAMVVTVQVRGA